MRAPTILAAALGALVVARSSPAAADGFDPRDLDKQAHLAVSYGLSLTGSLVLRRLDVPRWQAVAIAAAATLALGTVKELVLDDTYTWGDQLGNGLGTSGAAVVVFSLRL